MATSVNLRVALRRAIDQHLRTASALEAFLIDFFPQVVRELSSGMDRVTQVNRLLQSESEDAIQSALEHRLGGDVRAIAQLRGDLGKVPTATAAQASHPEGTSTLRRPTGSPGEPAPGMPLPPGTSGPASRNDRLPPLIFIEYDDEDRALVEELSRQLRPLEGGGRLRLFDRGKIPPGADFRAMIADMLFQATVIVPLISPDLLASDRFPVFVAQVMRPSGRRVIPLLARPALWEQTELGQLNPLPADHRFLSRLSRSEREHTLLEIAQALVRATGDPGASPPPATPKSTPLGIPPTMDSRLTPRVEVAPGSEPATPLNRPTAYVLHLSDLHFSSDRQVEPWLDFLEADLAQIRRDVPRLDAVVVSGDVTQVAAPTEFAAAAEFLRELQKTYQLAPHQVVLVPGNHDGDWKASQQAYAQGATESPGDKKKSAELYQQRFSAFADFYQAVCGQPYPLEFERQATLHPLAAPKLLVVGLNSAWECDHLPEHRGRASININALSSVLRPLRRDADAYQDWLKIAVWHHPIQSDGEDRLKNTGFLDRLAQAEFRLGLHGHLHAAQTSQHAYDVEADGRRIHLVGAGTFGAPTKEWRSGVPLQYQILRIEGGRAKVLSRCRDNPEGPWRGDGRWVAGAEARTYYEIPL